MFCNILNIFDENIDMIITTSKFARTKLKAFIGHTVQYEIFGTTSVTLGGDLFTLYLWQEKNVQMVAKLLIIGCEQIVCLS